MYQTDIDEYTKLVDKKLPEYLSSLPNPFANIKDYAIPKDGHCLGFPIEWFDVAAITALIRNHRDTKGKYEVNVYLIELLTSMFRVANYKLGWLTDVNATTLAGYLAHDRTLTENCKEILHELLFCFTRFPYDQSNNVWYSFLMPLLAYTNPRVFHSSFLMVMPNYISRYFVSIIDKYGLTINHGEHTRDINYDILECKKSIEGALNLCSSDSYRMPSKYKYEYYLKVLHKFAIIYLGSLLQRSSIIQNFGKIGSEIVSYHYVEFQEISHQYFMKQTNIEEKFNETPRS